MKRLIMLIALFVPLTAWSAETSWCPEFLDATKKVLDHRAGQNGQQLQAFAWGLPKTKTVHPSDRTRYDRLLRVQARRAGSKWFSAYTNEQLLVGAAEDCAMSDERAIARTARRKAQ